MLALLCAIAVGSIVPVQTAINTRLRESNGSPIVTAFYSFIIGTSLAAVGVWALGDSPLPDFSLLAHEPWWLWLGGFMGVTFIVGNILLFPRIGSVQTVVLPILGQAIMGLTIDEFGLYRSPQIDVTVWRLIGAVLVLLGVLMVLEVAVPGTWRGPLRRRTASPSSRPTSDAGVWLWRAFGVFIGMCSATQTAVNGQLGRVLDSTLQASEISLAVGLVILLVLSGALVARKQATLRVSRGPWWMWFGGVLGAFFVLGGATLAPVIGTGTMVIASVSGTMLAGQVVESLGLFGVRATPLDLRRVLGLAVIFVGVLMVRLL